MAIEKETLARIHALENSVSELTGATISIYGCLVAVWAGVNVSKSDSDKISAALDEVSKNLELVVEAHRKLAGGLDG